MKYLGKKSLSSFLAGLIHVAWYIVLVGSIVAAVAGAWLLFATPVEDPSATGIAKANHYIFSEMDSDKDWQDIKGLPFAVRLLFLPYFAAVVILLLLTLKESRHLFASFKNDEVFNDNNVRLISKISKLVIVLAIMTFNFASLLVGIILLIICAIFKSGAALQEEHDLTV